MWVRKVDIIIQCNWGNLLFMKYVIEHVSLHWGHNQGWIVFHKIDGRIKKVRSTLFVQFTKISIFEFTSIANENSQDS